MPDTRARMPFVVSVPVVAPARGAITCDRWRCRPLVTIALMPALMASGSVSQAFTRDLKSASAGTGGEAATDAFAAPASAICVFAEESATSWSGWTPFTRFNDPVPPDGVFR
jgi:hypothetical protein